MEIRREKIVLIREQMLFEDRAGGAHFTQGVGGGAHSGRGQCLC